MSGFCRHFGTCGGCTLQDIPSTEYYRDKRAIITQALARHGLDVTSVAQVIAVPPNSRRRAVLKIARGVDTTQIGFHALKSHAIVDMQECLVLTPALFALISRLRALSSTILDHDQHAEAHIAEADNGLDIAFRAKAELTPSRVIAIANASRELQAARITWNGKLAYEGQRPQVRFGNATVDIPPLAFLQPTRAGEDALCRQVLGCVSGANIVADLFSGCGTFALVVAQRAQVHALEREQSMLEALARAARQTSGLKPVTTERRDLFKTPLGLAELKRFDALVLNPPRAGALAQSQILAKSNVGRIAYVSCDAQSFARDALVLVQGGYKIELITPVDQFLWSSHIELVAWFFR